MSDTKKNKPDAIDQDAILEYFLFLYKNQIGAPKKADTNIVCVERSVGNRKMTAYDLHVMQNEQARTRRITVGPIGEGTGSKSKCFFVIYDNKLVLKIPPVPITDFDKYIASIKKERGIVHRVHPRECIVPGISVILRKVHRFHKDAEMTTEAMESAYVELLKDNPEMQDYLKINGCFVFFMDLARYRFLADALSIFNASEKKLQDEVTRDYTILDDFGKFEGRYGMANANIGMELKGVYTDYEARVRKLMIQSGASLSILLYKAQEWFFTHLAGDLVQPKGPDLSEAFVVKLNELIAAIMYEHRPLVDEYRQMIQAFLQYKTFSKHKLHMEGVVANIIELLAWLKGKGVAFRDMKPDNLLVAGDPEKYPNFLAKPESFTIGLIDMETAVYFKSDDPAAIEQPPLGGTPFYATPLHLFKNKTLLAVFKDLQRALYLQDWFAAVAMIYASITGTFLFPHTAKKIILATRSIQKAVKNKQPVTEILANVSHAFWASALEEFAAKTKENKHKLNAIRVELAQPAHLLILDELTAENRRKDNLVKQLIARQAIFKNQKNRQQLYLGTPERLNQIIATLKTKENIDVPSLTAIETILAIKTDMARNTATHQLVQKNPSSMSAYQVMEILFYIVYHFMYKEKWVQS
ncbi:MAG: hypothetical protein SWH61_10595 [Thermodesulfobacteriota bacterium]|nr:hypothetical protein [Thermodesulfobacteriota bacterium]